MSTSLTQDDIVGALIILGQQEHETVLAQQMVTDRILKLKNRKAAGEDSVNNELTKYGRGPMLEIEITKLHNKVIKIARVPYGWNTSTVIPI